MKYKEDDQHEESAQSADTKAFLKLVDASGQYACVPLYCHKKGVDSMDNNHIERASL